MSDIAEHINRVLDGHQEVVHLVQFGLVGDHLSHEEGVQDSVPVQESAASGLADIGFPVADQVELPVPEVDLTQLLVVEHVFLNEVHAMADDSATQLVITTSVALQNSDHKLEHVIEVKSFLQFVDILSTSLH